MPNTQSKEVNLTKRVQTHKSPRYCPVVVSRNGRVKPDLVIVNGQPEPSEPGRILFPVVFSPFRLAQFLQ